MKIIVMFLMLILLASCTKDLETYKKPRADVVSKVATDTTYTYFKETIDDVRVSNPDTDMYYAFDTYNNKPLLIAVDDEIANEYHYTEIRGIFDESISVIEQEPLCYEFRMVDNKTIKVTQRGTSYNKTLEVE